MLTERPRFVPVYPAQFGRAGPAGAARKPNTAAPACTNTGGGRRRSPTGWAARGPKARDRSQPAEV